MSSNKEQPDKSSDPKDEICEDPQDDELLDDVLKNFQSENQGGASANTAPTNLNDILGGGGCDNPDNINEAANALVKEFDELFNGASTDDLAKRIGEMCASTAGPDGVTPDVNEYLKKTLETLNTTAEELSSSDESVNMSKLFEMLGSTMGGTEGGEGAEDMAKNLETMFKGLLGNLLSRDVIYAPMKELSTNFEKWIEDNKEEMAEEEMENRKKQLELVKGVIRLFDEEKEDDTEEVKSQRMDKIMDLMQELQETGSLPESLCPQGKMPGAEALGGAGAENNEMGEQLKQLTESLQCMQNNAPPECAQQ